MLARLHAAIALPCHGRTTDPQLLERNLDYFSAVRRHCLQSIDNGSLPTGWMNAQNLANIVSMPYEEALAIAHVDSAQIPAIYQDFHERAIKATLVVLQASKED